LLTLGVKIRAYVGFPAAFEAFRVADRVLNEMEERGEIKREK
jgi:4-carboxymuconolactone decarboxylase